MMDVAQHAESIDAGEHEPVDPGGGWMPSSLTAFAKPT